MVERENTIVWRHALSWQCRMHRKELVPCCCNCFQSRQNRVACTRFKLYLKACMPLSRMVQHGLLPYCVCQSSACRVDLDPFRLLVPDLRSGLGCCLQTLPSSGSPGQVAQAADRLPSAKQSDPERKPALFCPSGSPGSLWRWWASISFTSTHSGHSSWLLVAFFRTQLLPSYDADSSRSYVSLALDPLPHPLLAYPCRIDASCFVCFHPFDPLPAVYGRPARPCTIERHKIK